MSSPAFEREALRRAASKSKSYVDLTSGDDEVMPLQISRTRASSGAGMCFPLSQRSLSDPKRTTCPVQADSTPSSTSEEIPELGEEEYEIDCIVNSRFRTARGQCVLEFLIHWKGYADEDRSWTPASQSEEDDPPVVQFYLKQPGKPGIGQKSPVRGMDMRHFFERSAERRMWTKGRHRKRMDIRNRRRRRRS